MTATFSFSDIARDLIRLVNPVIAKRYRVLPIRLEGYNLTLVRDGDLSSSDMDTLRASFRYSLSFVPISAEEMDEALRQYYPD